MMNNKEGFSSQICIIFVLILRHAFAYKVFVTYILIITIMHFIRVLFYENTHMHVKALQIQIQAYFKAAIKLNRL